VKLQNYVAFISADVRSHYKMELFSIRCFILAVDARQCILSPIVWKAVHMQIASSVSEHTLHTTRAF